jgi:hypothetical protein
MTQGYSEDGLSSLVKNGLRRNPEAMRISLAALPASA